MGLASQKKKIPSHNDDWQHHHPHKLCIIFLLWKILANSGFDWLWFKLTDWPSGGKPGNSEIKEYFFLFFFNAVLEIEPKLLIILGKYSTIKPNPYPEAANVMFVTRCLVSHKLFLHKRSAKGKTTRHFLSLVLKPYFNRYVQ